METPIADSLKKALDEIPKKIEKEGFAQGTVSLTGVEVEVGERWKKLTLSGYAAKQWGGNGWTAGARAKVVW